MPLTPEDVHKKTFTPVRLREGYDMGEVDQFLDDVEVELTRLHADNDDLREKLTAAQSGTGYTPPATTDSSQAPEQETAAQATPVAAVTPAPVVTSVPEASTAAARLLEIAARNADELVGEAKNDADKILGEARSKAERLESDSKTKATSVESDAHTRAEQLDVETAQRREQALGELERDREDLARELEDLRAFEREYRSRLKGYFQSQLRALDGEGDDEVPLTPSSDGETPNRLRELLSEE